MKKKKLILVIAFLFLITTFLISNEIAPSTKTTFDTNMSIIKTGMNFTSRSLTNDLSRFRTNDDEKSLKREFNARLGIGFIGLGTFVLPALPLSIAGVVCLSLGLPGWGRGSGWSGFAGAVLVFAGIPLAISGGVFTLASLTVMIIGFALAKRTDNKMALNSGFSGKDYSMSLCIRL